MTKSNLIKPFNTKKSISNFNTNDDSGNENLMTVHEAQYMYKTALDRLTVIRTGIPYNAIELISQRLNNPVKSVLALMGIPQTTYNKKKSEQLMLDSRDSELLILINELLDYGLDVFNNEENKFQAWLKKPNLSIGGNRPESLLDTVTGINEVKFALTRLEFGNLA